MREKLKTLPLSELKELAKSQGLKGISAMRKADIIELLCRQAEKNEEAQKEKPQPAQEQVAQRGFQVAGEQAAQRGPQAEQEQTTSRAPQQEREQAPQRAVQRAPRTEQPERSFREKSQERQDNRNNQGEGRRSYVRSYDRYAQSRPSQNKPAGNSYSSSNAGGSTNPTPSQPPQQQAPAADSPERSYRTEQRNDAPGITGQDMAELDSGIGANGILEVMPDGFGFLRCENFLPGENDVYASLGGSPWQSRRGLPTQ